MKKEQAKAGIVSNFTPVIIAALLTEVNGRREATMGIFQRVALRMSIAGFIWGKGGMGKSDIFKRVKKEMPDRQWVHHTGSSSAIGFFEKVEKTPDGIHVLEDMEDAYRDQDYIDILRPMADNSNKACAKCMVECSGKSCPTCGGQTGGRLIQRVKSGSDRKFIFTGGLVIISNRNISKTDGPLGAVATRFNPVEWYLTLDEMCAVMLDIGKRDFEGDDFSLPSKDCTEVAEFCVKVIRQGELSGNMSLRFLTHHAYACRMQYNVQKEILKGKEPNVHWTDSILTLLKGRASMPTGRDERNAQLEATALRISLLPCKFTEKVKRFKEETGVGKSQFIEHLKNARAANSR